jgi:hypothetical protein
MPAHHIYLIIISSLHNSAGHSANVQTLDSMCHFPAKTGSKSDPHPRPPDLHQNVPNNIANTPGKLLAPEGSFWKSLSDGFPPCPPGHLPPQTEYAGVLSYVS